MALTLATELRVVDGIATLSRLASRIAQLPHRAVSALTEATRVKLRLSSPFDHSTIARVDSMTSRQDSRARKRAAKGEVKVP